MSVNLTTTDYIDYGDNASLSGATSLTVAVRFKASSFANDERILSQWGSGGGEWGFILSILDTNEILFATNNDSVGGSQTTALNLSTGVEYSVVAKWTTAGVIKIWVNGTLQSVTDFSSGAPRTQPLFNAAASIRVGADYANTSGIDADYAHVAIWTSAVPDADCEAISNSALPSSYTTGGILYAPLPNTSDMVDDWSSISPTSSGASNGTAFSSSSGKPAFYYAQL